jgi:hypothetical protein
MNHRYKDHVPTCHLVFACKRYVMDSIINIVGLNKLELDRLGQKTRETDGRGISSKKLIALDELES